MKKIQKFEADDGSVHDTKELAQKRDALLKLLAAAMLPMGTRHERIGEGWVQHDPDAVKQVKISLLKLARPMLKGFPEIIRRIDHDPASIHPMSIVGRVLDDSDSPINDGWFRLCCTDEQGREFQQPYFAINGPDKHLKQLN